MLTPDQILDLAREMAVFYGILSAPRKKDPTPEMLWKTLCSYGIHDYEFIVINQEGALLECFYCGHQKLSKKLWMKGRR